MKDAMTGFDVRAVSLELDAWSGAYVKKAYMPHYEQIVLRINPKEAEQFDLVIVRGQRVYTSKRDRPMPMTPPSFAMVLRKHLKNARMTKVEQLGFDRVLMFRFDTKNGQRSLSVELFRNGNVILMDENDVIIQPLTHASYSGRTIKKGEIYVPPPAAIDPHTLTLDALKQAFEIHHRAAYDNRLFFGLDSTSNLCISVRHKIRSGIVFTGITNVDQRVWIVLLLPLSRFGGADIHATVDQDGICADQLSMFPPAEGVLHGHSDCSFTNGRWPADNKHRTRIGQVVWHHAGYCPRKNRRSSSARLCCTNVGRP